MSEGYATALPRSSQVILTKPFNCSRPARPEGSQSENLAKR